MPTPFKKELQVKSDQKMSNKDVKKLKEQSATTFNISNDAAAALVGKDVALRKTGGGLIAKLYCDGAASACLFEIDDGRPLPTLTALWRLPTLLPPLLVPPAVSEFVLSGADLMLPGVIGMAEGVLELSAGDAVCVLVSGNPAAVAIGRIAMGGAELGAALKATPRPKGLAVEVLHVFGDTLWRYCGKPIPNAGFSLGCKAVAPLGTDARATPPPPPPPAPAAVAAALPPPPPTAKSEQSEEEEEERTDGEDDEHEADGDAAAPVVPIARATPTTAPLAAPDCGEGEGEGEGDEGEAVDKEAKDELLRRCFLRAAHAIADTDLPMGLNAVWAGKMRPLRPAGTSLELKGSSYKKLSAFFAAMEGRALCTLKQPAAKGSSGSKKGAPSAGEPLLFAIGRGAHEYSSFEPWPIEATAEARGGAGSGGSGGSGGLVARMVLSDVFRPLEGMRPLFEGQGHVDRKTYYTLADALDVLARHVAAARSGGIEGGGSSSGGAVGGGRAPAASDVIVLDPLLADSLYKGAGKSKGGGGGKEGAGAADVPVPTHLPYNEICARFKARLEPWVRVTGGQLEKPLMRPGHEPPTLTVQTQQRRGHMVTLVDELEVLSIEPEKLARALQAKLGAHATVYEAEVKSGAVKRSVMVQGLWDLAVSECLQRDFGVPVRCVHNLAADKKGMHQKKEKAATNVRRG